MELFRTISPNGGSISAIEDTDGREPATITATASRPSCAFGLPYERNGYIITPHTSTSFDPRHWTNPQQFDPEPLP